MAYATLVAAALAKTRVAPPRQRDRACDAERSSVSLDDSGVFSGSFTPGPGAFTPSARSAASSRASDCVFAGEYGVPGTALPFVGPGRPPNEVLRAAAEAKEAQRADAAREAEREAARLEVERAERE